jgi:type II secretory ATPase GspE/PulE/Tfp pilus assembly ATPase PilB-like protein/DNA-binding response OmpR family regulator
MSQYTSLFTDSAEEEPVEPRDKVQPYTILIVDDEPNIVNALRRVFRQENYRILTASNGQEALDVLAGDNCQLMIADYMMPVMNGAELLRTVKQRYPDMIRIMLTGHADTEAVMSAIKEGAVYKFILKPWNDDDLRVTVALALEQYDLMQSNRNLQKQNRASAKEINELSRLSITNRSQLAILLHKRNLLNEQQVQELYKLQQSNRQPVLKLILKKEWVEEKKIRELLRKDFMIREVSLDEVHIDAGILALIPRSLCERHLVLPLEQHNRKLTLVMADPMDEGLLDDLKFAIGLDIEPAMADVDAIRAKLNEIYGEEDTALDDIAMVLGSSDPYEGIEILIEDEDEISLEELLRDTNEPPAIRLVNVVILEAIRLGASDIHIHPRTKSVVVRYRIDGVLVDKIHIPHSLHMALISRIKVMSELDITERRRPQDGRITVKTPMQIIDLRISTLPTINGEKVVMRILDRNASVADINDLGMSEIDLIKVKNAISKPQGIILATGPTGSGKTTTLYSLMQSTATSEKNYVTIEDPVEYFLDAAGQVMVKEKIGLDFARVLRAILRQDPDVILLGEIRDKETAEVAFHAALTGHLVYSTLHTNSAIATIARLFDLGLKPYIVASALEAVIAQRLVRKICVHCRREITPDSDLVHKLGPVFEDKNLHYFKGTGCTKCNDSGYKGRVPLYEVLVISEKLRHLISMGASILEIMELAAEEGTSSLIQDARIRIDKGLTTVEEVLRVLGTQVIM